MISPQVDRMSDGGLRLSRLAPWFVRLMLELPELLDSDQPESVRRRLYPEPSDDEDQKRDWDKFVRPELFALIASARDIVLRDIGVLGLDADEEVGFAFWSLDIPAEHIQAWISALNVARLTLSERYELHGEDPDELDAEQLEEKPPAEIEEWTEKQLASERIFLLGWLQELLIEAESPRPEGFEGPY